MTDAVLTKAAKHALTVAKAKLTNQLHCTLHERGKESTELQPTSAG